ncbi:acyl CoA binding protein-domain-containing protein [Collybia nuda]|uniref:Acyl CoA binding protein-domain-containing protein n=1 Tax=Collybia nuda TaxID=64659 RepID=A0A9P6CDV4_9AGAR|nr:acyl CoA binding protein-domain-containing protein [Collybia nuda]
MPEFVENVSSSFSNASTYLSSVSSLSKVSAAIKLELYGLFKYVTMSSLPNTSRPSIFDLTGRAKWDAWNSAGTTYFRKQDAENRYIEIAKTLGWTEDSEVSDSKSQQPAEETTSDRGIVERVPDNGIEGMGVAVSTMARPAEFKEETLHGVAIRNDVQGLLFFLEKYPDADLNSRDEFGYTPLHLAADRGHLPIIQILVDRGVEIMIKDPDGFIAFELASIAGHDAIRELLSP